MMTLLISVVLLMLPSLQAVQGQENVPFSCNCILGTNATSYHIKVVQEPGHATVTFSKLDKVSNREKIEVEGTLVEFQFVGGDLVLSLVYPGPHTLVFSDDQGQIRQELDCSSDFTALFTWSRAVCFSGKRIDQNGVVSPERAIIYDRSLHPYKQISDVPYQKLYSELSKISLK